MNDGRDTSKLKIILVEESTECFDNLKEVIEKVWPTIDLKQAIGDIGGNNSNAYLLNKQPSEALDIIEKIPSLGNSLFFFDPLLYSPWSEIERVAKRRIVNYYRTRTEFIVFLFTSDWFDGRKKADLAALPENIREAEWNADQLKTVVKVDDLFGNKNWRTLLQAAATQQGPVQSVGGRPHGKVFATTLLIIVLGVSLIVAGSLLAPQAQLTFSSSSYSPSNLTLTSDGQKFWFGMGTLLEITILCTT